MAILSLVFKSLATFDSYNNSDHSLADCSSLLLIIIRNSAQLRVPVSIIVMNTSY